MSPPSRVLVLGAHPDDEMGCAGAISRLKREGAEVRLVTFSQCRDLNGPGLVAEWSRAAELMGIDAELGDLPNRRLPEHRQDILDELDKHRGKYDLVLCPARYDAHQDHAAVTNEAVRALKGTTILGYELPLNHVGGSELGAFVKLTTADMHAKLAHVGQYASQADKPYMNSDYVRGLARVRGVQAGCEFAEAFEVIRWVW